MFTDKNVEKIVENARLKILICGRKIDKTITSLIINKKDYEFESIDINSNKEFTLTNYDKPKWEFYEFKDGYNQKTKDKIYDIIHKNFGIKGRDIETSLIFFTEDDEDDKDLLNFFDSKKAYYHPFILFITKNKQKDKHFYDNFIKENEIEFDERNIYVINTNETENNIIQERILKILWNNCRYYNGIGDDIFFPNHELLEIENEVNELHNNCLNIYIIGKIGAGKSRLVNVICNQKKAKERLGGGSFSEGAIKYYVGKYPIALYDTQGFNSKEDIKLLIKSIDRKMKQITDVKEQIHGIFYVINQSSTRTLDEGEIHLIKNILNHKIPIFFLMNFTKYKNIKKRNNYLESFLEICQNEYPDSNISKHVYLINLENDDEDNIIFGLKSLFESLYDYYKPEKVFLDELNSSFDSENELDCILKAVKHSIFFRNIINLKDALKICHIRAENMIKIFIASSCLFSLFPIPGVYSISSIEVILFSCILGCYGYKIDKIDKEHALKSLGTSVFGATVGYAVGNALLMIPGIGYIIGTIIKGSVASVTVYSIGKLCIKYCEENFEKNNAVEFYKNLIINYNNAINSLKTVSEDFQEDKII